MTLSSVKKKVLLKETNMVWANPTILFLYELLIVSSDKSVIPISNTEKTPFLAWQYINTLRHLIKELKAIETFPATKQHSFSFWKLNQSLQSRPFLDSVRFMREHNIELKSLWSLAITQFQREQMPAPNVTIEKQLNFYAEAYSKFIGLIFRNGVTLTQKSANPLKMYELGSSFGKLVYILHTFEAYSIKGKVNVFHHIFKNSIINRTEEEQIALTVYFKQLHQKVIQQIKTMNLEESKMQYFVELLDQWVLLKMKNEE